MNDDDDCEVYILLLLTMMETMTMLVMNPLITTKSKWVTLMKMKMMMSTAVPH